MDRRWPPAAGVAVRRGRRTDQLRRRTTNGLRRVQRHRVPRRRRHQRRARDASDHGAPSVAQISSALTQLAEQASVSGAEPTTQAGQPAYNVSITPKHDAGLLGRAEIAWDAANGIPLRVAVTAAGNNSPVLALEVTDISYGSVDPGTFAITPPASAKVVDLGSLTHSGNGNRGPLDDRRAERSSLRRPVHARRA